MYTNAQILTESINQWMTPIVEGAIQNMANKNMMTSMLSQLITPDRLLKSVKDHLSVPMIEHYISKIPDHTIPALSSDIIDGMIATRMEKGALEIPMIGVKLGPNTFKGLKSICEKNFAEYGYKEESQSQKIDVQPTKNTTKDTN